MPYIYGSGVAAATSSFPQNRGKPQYFPAVRHHANTMSTDILRAATRLWSCEKKLMTRVAD